MTFFVIAIVSVVYYLVFRKTVRGFVKEILLRDLPPALQGRWHSHKAHVRITYRFITHTLVWIGASIAYFLLERARRLKAEREAEAKAQQRREREEREREELRTKNLERAAARLEWLKTHPVTLYYHTQQGVRVVVRPTDYNAAEQETIRARRDEHWEHTRTLMPIERSYLFVTKRGEEQVRQSMPTNDPFQWVCGRLSDLDAMVGRYKEQGVEVILVQKKNLFVPHINEVLQPFPHRTQGKCPNFGFDLVETQAPAELQPLREF